MFHYMDIFVINDRLSYYEGSLRIQPAGLQDLLRYTGSWNPLHQVQSVVQNTDDQDTD